jgi:hypothetical protein
MVITSGKELIDAIDQVGVHGYLSGLTGHPMGAEIGEIGFHIQDESMVPWIVETLNKEGYQITEAQFIKLLSAPRWYVKPINSICSDLL